MGKLKFLNSVGHFVLAIYSEGGACIGDCNLSVKRLYLSVVLLRIDVSISR